MQRGAKNKLNILVTGGNGFIGKNLIEVLYKKHQGKIYCLDNYYSSNYYSRRNLGEELIFINRDIRYSILHLFKDIEIDIIYHLACPASPPAYQKDFIYTHETAIYGLLNVLHLAREKNSKVLFTSTSEVYGDPEVDIQTESYRGNVDTLGPRACYDETKRVGETICWDYHKSYGMDIKIARIFNTYGPHMDINDGRIVTNFIGQCLNNLPLTIYGDGNQTRSLCYVSDCVDALIKLANSNDKRTTVSPINIGHPEELTILEIARIIKKLTNSESKIEYRKLPINDPMKRKPCIKKAKELLDWTPKNNLINGMGLTIEHFLQNSNIRKHE